MLAPDSAAPLAFVAGVMGPLIGADLLHLKDIEKVGAGMVSIGGAGTFDGIVMSAIVAAYLARRRGSRGAAMMRAVYPTPRFRDSSVGL